MEVYTTKERETNGIAEPVSSSNTLRSKATIYQGSKCTYESFSYHAMMILFTTLHFYQENSSRLIFSGRLDHSHAQRL